MFIVVDGNLLDAKEDYICHQTNCVSKGQAAGLARTIFDTFPEVDVYKGREIEDVPGTIKVRSTKCGKKVINMMGQFWPGPPKRLNDDFPAQRLLYFRKCLFQMSQELPATSSYAFPWRIGCGIASGDWGKYIEVLKNFETFMNKRNSKANVVLYKLPS